MVAKLRLILALPFLALGAAFTQVGLWIEGEDDGPEREEDRT